jgi:hypothetical protein
MVATTVRDPPLLAEASARIAVLPRWPGGAGRPLLLGSGNWLVVTTGGG